MYCFSQSDYKLIIIVHILLKDTKYTFDLIHVHPHQYKKDTEQITTLHRASILADRKIEELRLHLDFDPTVPPIFQSLLPIWLTINDIHITSKLKTTILNTINDIIFKTGFPKKST